MGQKCSCVSTPSELRPDTINTVNGSISRNGLTSSTVDSGTQRFCIKQEPLRLDKVFETTNTKYQRIELIEAKELNDDSDSADSQLLQSISDSNSRSFDIHQSIDFLVSGFIRNNLDSHYLEILPIIKQICQLYYSIYSLSIHNDVNTQINSDPDSYYSKILNDMNEEKNLLELLHNHWKSEWQLIPYYLPIIHLQLLYRASRDGINDNFKMFHKKVDGKGKTLMLIQTKNDHIFGGFTSISYNLVHENKMYYDRNAFLFSLTRNEIYDINRNGVNLGNGNIFHHDALSEIGIHFGSGPDLIIKNNCCLQQTSQSMGAFSFNFSVDQLIGKQNDNGHFLVTELEIFRVYGI